MMKEVIRSLETGMLSEIGLIAFFVAFLLILARVALMSRDERTKAKNLPLDEADELHPPSTENGFQS